MKSNPPRTACVRCLNKTGEWAKVEAAIDSAATDVVVPRDFMPFQNEGINERSQEGRHYVGANNTLVEKCGEKDPIGFSQIAFPIIVPPKDDRTHSAQEEQLGLPYWTMILTICVVVDESKCLDTPILEFQKYVSIFHFHLGIS